MEERLEQTEQEEIVPVKKSGKKRWIVLAVVLVAVAALVGLCCYAYIASGNNYKTPIALDAEIANARTYQNDLDLHLKALNGFAKKEADAVFEAVRQTAGYQQSLEEEQWYFDEAVGFNKKAYGEDWEIRYKVVSSEKLNANALERYSESLKAYAETLEASLTGNEQVDESLKAYAAKLRNAKVTDGYSVAVKIIIDGSEAPAPEEQNQPMTVFKVDGRWVKQEIPTEFASEAVKYAVKGS